MQDCALHDQQEFVVADLMDWGFDDNNNVLIKVHWLGFEDSEDTWEPMAQLYEDVKHKVEKYVKEEDDPQLTEHFRSLVSAENSSTKRVKLLTRNN